MPQGEKTSQPKRFAETRIGYVHIDVCKLRRAQGKLFMFLAGPGGDRVSTFARVAFLDANTKAKGAAFLSEAVKVFPYRIQTVLTDDGMAFADLPTNRGRHPEIETPFGGHIFDRVRDKHDITPKLTKPYRPCTHGQAERLNRTVKHTAITTFRYPDRQALRSPVLAFVTA